jgi:hypothetical protein
VATAAIVIAIITFSFLAVHEPAEDPFQKNNSIENRIQTGKFRPNPVDAAFLSHFRRRRYRPGLKDTCLKVRLLVVQVLHQVVDVIA